MIGIKQTSRGMSFHGEMMK